MVPMAKRPSLNSLRDFCRALCSSFCSAGVRSGGAIARASTRYTSVSPALETNSTGAVPLGIPTKGKSRNHRRGVNSTNIKIRITATSYCHDPRSYDQKNVRESICPRLAISIRRNAVDDHAVTHVHHAVEIRRRLWVMRDHHDGLSQVLV